MTNRISSTIISPQNGFVSPFFRFSVFPHVRFLYFIGQVAADNRDLEQSYILCKRTVPVSGGFSPVQFCAASLRLLAGAVDCGQVKTRSYFRHMSYSE